MKFKSRIVPKAYDQLEFIQLTGTQYIDTGMEFDPSKNTTISIDLEFTELGTSSSAKYIFGNTEASNKLAVNTYVSGAIYTYCGSSSGKSSARIPQLNQKYNIKVVATPTRYDYYLDDTLLVTYTTGLPTAKIGMPLIFGNYWRGGTDVDNSRAFRGRFYNIKVVENDVLIRNFIPVLRKIDNVVGMYDTVEGKFYTNAGTGSFIAGEKILTVDKVKIQSNDVQELRLPYNGNKYKFFDYIQSTGTQYIDTGFKPNNNTHIKVDVYSTNTSKNIVNFGCWNTAYNDGAYSITNGAGGGTAIYAGYDGQGGNLISGSVTNFPATFEIDKNVVKVNDVVKYTFTTSTFSVNYNLTLFATNRAGVITWAQEGINSQYAISSCKIWDNTILVRDFIPAQRLSDNAIGMYEKVTDTFFANKGTGSFIAGSEIKPMLPFWKKYPDVPKKYEVKEYLESTGTQYIDTGVIPANKKLEAREGFQFVRAVGTSASTNSTGGSMPIDGTNNFNLARIHRNKWRYKINNKGTFGSAYDLDYHTCIINSPTGTYFDDVKITSDGYPTTQQVIASTNTKPVLLFAENTATTTGNTPNFFGYVRLFYVRFYSDGVLIRDFIPVKRKSDNVLGMYDTVTDTLFTNAGTGTFSAG